MKEKIRKLAKGVEKIDTPAVRLVPESIEQDIAAGASDSFVVGVMSDNGIIVKGVMTSDDPRVSPEPMVFAGRTNYISVNVSAAGLGAGAVIDGALTLITEAGEYRIPYHIKTYPAEEAAAEDKETIENPLSFDVIKADGDGDADAGTPSFPEDPEVFTELISELIRAHDDSAYAYAAYREAVARGLSVTGLYESLVLAYPFGAGEEIPREVVLYFYFDSDIPARIAERLYAAVLSFEAPDSETVMSLASRMSAFAMSHVLSSSINERLAIIYDHMIYKDMLDERVAGVLPDILRCARITVTRGDADYLLVTYPDFDMRLRSPVRDHTAYVPLYFDSAAIDFYELNDSDEGGLPVGERVEYSKEWLFSRPDLLLGCFELCPQHRMLVLSAVREITARGIRTPHDREVLIQGLRDEAFSESLRAAIIRVLAGSGGDLDWIRYLKDEDFRPETLKDLFAAFLSARDFESAYTLVKRFGPEFAEPASLRKLMDHILTKHGGRLEEDAGFTRLGMTLFECGQASDRLIEFLAAHYLGSIDSMLRLMDTAAKKRLNISVLPENILSFMLFSGVSERIDDVFRVYLGCERHDDLLMDAYFALRSADWFLYEEEVDKDLIFPALYKYIHALPDPMSAPGVSLIALSAYFSERDSLSEDEAALLKLIVDELIDEGLVFRYTKRLKRLIQIPEEIAWRYYIEYHVPRGSDDTPKLLMRVLPDDTDFHEEEMKRVYRGVFVADTVLLTGDKLEYRVYPSYAAEAAAYEGVISVAREQKESNERMKSLNRIIKAISSGDDETARDTMLRYAQKAEAMRILFDPGDT